ncbi:MAG: MaoC/PaaZ C-terminal domain-containing protein [Anaerolineae bacterium]
MADLVRTGTYFEDLEMGQTFTSPARTITESDIVAFSGVSGDYNPLHTDEEFARQTPFGGRVAHGLLGLSIASGLASRIGFLEGTVLAFLGLEWKFREPIRPGDTIHISGSVGEKKAMPRLGGGIVELSIEVKNQAGARAQKGTWRLLIKSRTAESA